MAVKKEKKDTITERIFNCIKALLEVERSKDRNKLEEVFWQCRNSVSKNTILLVIFLVSLYVIQFMIYISRLLEF